MSNQSARIGKNKRASSSTRSCKQSLVSSSNKISKKKKKQKPNLKDSVKLSIPQDYPWKVLDALVKDLRYLLDESQYATIASIMRNRDFEAYLALGEEWGLQSISLRDKPLAQVRALYQISALLKKFRFATDRTMRLDAAKKKFWQGEANCAQYNNIGYKDLVSPKEEWMVDVFTYARSFFVKLLGHSVPDSDLMTEWSRHGPGSNLDTTDGRTSTYYKYSDWPYSCTTEAMPYARCMIMDDPRWFGALEDSYREKYNIPKHSILDWKLFWKRVFNIVDHNRVGFVPKNALTERSIAIEPAMNVLLQLGIDGYIRRRLKRWGVDIDDQRKNQLYAQLGSFITGPWRDKFCTLDLVGASENIATKLCYHLLPPEWYNYLMKTRSPYGKLDGEVFEYEKISSMGNGFTFALETALFTSIVYGVMMHVEGRYDPKRCAIFGDDIIVTDNIVNKVIIAFANCGFKINTEKSFFEGPIRESCGADWFDGSPVRPVFLDESPTTVMGLWTDVNRLTRLLNLRWWIEKSHVRETLVKWIPEKFRSITGPLDDESFDSYLHDETPENGAYRHSLWKYKRLIVKPGEFKGPAFLMRKLMHDLRPTSDKPPFFWRNVWKGARLMSDGSRFNVTRRNSVKLGYTYSYADIWRMRYTETYTNLQRLL